MSIALALALSSALGTGGGQEAADDPMATARAARLAAQRQAQEAAEAPSGIDHDRWMQRAQECLDAADSAIFAEGAVGWFPVRDLEAMLEWNRPLKNAPDRILAQRVRHEQYPLAAIVDFREQLARAGVELVFVPIPHKAHVYPEELIGVEAQEDFHGHAPGMRYFYRFLNEAGVEVVDLVTPFSRARAYGGAVSSMFLHRDSHWAPRAAKIAAQEVAAVVKAMPWYEPGRLKEGEDFFRQESSPALLVGLCGGSEELRFERILDADGLSFVARDRQSPVLVIGDSFVNFHQGMGAHFSAYLAAELGREPDVISSPGAGRLGVRQSIRARPMGLEGKKVVIWMIASRCLPPNKRWMPLDLGVD